MADETTHDDKGAVEPQQYIRDQIRKLVLMKETGPKSAAWHRARVGTIWRLHQQLAAAEQTSRNTDTKND